MFFHFLKISHYTWESFPIVCNIILCFTRKKTEQESYAAHSSSHTHNCTKIFEKNLWISSPDFFTLFFRAAILALFFLLWWITVERGREMENCRRKNYFYVFRMLKIETQRDWLDPIVGFRKDSSWSPDTCTWSRCESRLELCIFCAFLWGNCTKHSPPSLRRDHRINKRRNSEEWCGVGGLEKLPFHIRD